MQSPLVLDQQIIRRELGDLAALFDIAVFQQIDSTNSYLLGNPPAAALCGLCVSEFQTAGRGRHGNRWYASAGDNLLFSLSWQFEHWPTDICALSVAAGMVIAQRLNQDFALHSKIKWPNDLMLGDAKLGGILIELAGQARQCCQVVVGVGINILQKDHPHQYDYPLADLSHLPEPVERNKLAARLARDLRELLIGFEKQGFAPLKHEFNALSALHQQPVVVIKEGREYLSGTVIGIADAGQLLIRQANGKIQEISDSRVSIRKTSSISR